VPNLLKLFIDDGGVLNNNARRGPQFARLVAKYLQPRLGGSPEAWTAANLEVAAGLFERHFAHFKASPYASWHAVVDDYEVDWLCGMCARVGVAAPLDRATARRLARECDAYVTRRVHTAIPGSVAAIRMLRRAGFTLLTASGEASWELDGYLTGMRVRAFFDGHLYGPDQVDAAKASPLYYERVFAHCGVTPTNALVVDDSEQALDWAAETGANTVLCNATAPVNRRHGHIANLAALPGLLSHAGSEALATADRGDR
jgi:beta-phosphoglucomutase-like phosphatase (HAD superfamily)